MKLKDCPSQVKAYREAKRPITNLFAYQDKKPDIAKVLDFDVEEINLLPPAKLMRLQ